MGGGTWTSCAFRDYSKSVGRSVSESTGEVTTHYAYATQAYTKTNLDPVMDPKVEKNRLRECCDSEDHPSSIPIIMALDVTGSMGQTAIEVSKKLNTIIQGIADKLPDASFMVMGIGDLDYDEAPIQYSQFESDIRIAQNLDSIYFEMGGGPNAYESYTAAWYVGARRTRCDCWKRGEKGLILTIGDEILNPVLPIRQLSRAIGEDLDDSQSLTVKTPDLYKEVSEKYDVGHIVVDHRGRGEYYYSQCSDSFSEVIGAQMVATSTVPNISDTIVKFVLSWADSRRSSPSAATPKLKVETSGDGTMSVISWA